MTKTFTPAIPDALMIACGGNMNMAALAVRVAAFIQGDGGDSSIISIDTICGIFPWTDKSVKSYAKRLQVLGIFVVKFGAYRGLPTEWRKGENFSTFFGGERVKIFPRKGENFSTLYKYNNKQQLNNNKYINNIKDFACGDEIPLNTFFKLCGTTDVNEASERGCGNWQQLPHDKDRGIWYRKIGG